MPEPRGAELVFQKVLDCSTAHVTKQDMDMLESHGCGIVAYNYDEGAFVYVSPDGEYDKDIASEFSEAFRNLLRLARKHKCMFLRLDADGTQYPGLREFDWL